MAKYKTEGSIDFYAELYKSLDIEEEEIKTEEDNHKCLITNKPLIDKYITMKCGHKFNYIPLFNDLINHKKKFNFMEGNQGRLKTNEIRCPYCRKKQCELLPYYPDMGLNKENGINYFDPNIKENSAHKYNYNNSNKCEYSMISPNFDETKPESEINKKYYCCGSTNFTSKINLYNPENIHNPITYNDEKYYCSSHKKQMIKYYKMEEKQKAKKIIKEKMELEKQKLKEEKQKLKEEKQKAKELLKFKNKKPENVIIGLSQINKETENEDNENINNSGCIQILKTGPNKGKPCQCKVSANNLCLRHYKSVNNIIINN